MVVSRLGPIHDPLRNRGIPTLPFIYIGLVKGNADAQRMGRLAVWIPDIGGDPNDESSWVIASYASPFAGASDITRINGYTTNNTVAQQSYGLWLVPPDLNNEVAVFFANGDVSRAYWFACTYQQYMNFMVPGIAINVTTEPSPPIHVSPVIEYNKADKNNNITSPRRPPFQPLTNGLDTEGLNKDNERGSSSTSARREAPSEVFGLLSPRGNSIHIDDNAENEFIRMRTRSGAQILIHETTGYVYINSKNGNAWLEISDAGIDAYSSNAISIRAQGDVNVRADRSISLDADQDIAIRAGGSITMEAGKDIQVKAANDVITSAGHDFQVGAKNNMTLSAGKDGTIKLGGDFDAKAGGRFRTESGSYTYVTSGGDIRLQSTTDTHLKAGGKQFRDGTSIMDNTGGALGAGHSAAVDATAPTTPAGTSKLDTTPRMSDGKWIWNASGGMISTVGTRMPTHEPWKDHPRSNVPPPPLEDVPIDYQPTYGVGSSSNDANAAAGTDINDSGCSFGASNTKPCSTEVYNSIVAAASKTGADPATMLAFADMESSFQPGAGAKSSSATGLYQFTNGTWNSMVTKYGNQYNVSSDGINDASSNALMGGQFIQDNAAILKAKGVTDPTPGQLYIMHFMGSGGGPALISAAQSNPSADASSMFPAAAGANPTIFSGKTVGQVYSTLTAKADSKATAYANQYSLSAPCLRSTGTASGAPPGSDVPSSGNPALPSNFEQYKGKSIGSGQCVALVEQVGGLPLTAKWKQGDPPTASTPIGTPLATFQNGRYTNDTGGLSHAGFFGGMLPDGSGFTMVDQWSGKPVGVRTYKYGAGNGRMGGTGGIANASNYRVINL